MDGPALCDPGVIAKGTDAAGFSDESVPSVAGRAAISTAARMVSGADLEGADLSRVQVSHANVTGAAWTDGRICAGSSIGSPGATTFAVRIDSMGPEGRSGAVDTGH